MLLIFNKVRPGVRVMVRISYQNIVYKLTNLQKFAVGVLTGPRLD